MDWKVLKPNYTITIQSERAQRLYTKVLILKIAAQLIILGLMLMLFGWPWLDVLVVFGVVAAYKGTVWYVRKRRFLAAQRALADASRPVKFHQISPPNRPSYPSKPTDDDGK